MNLTETRNMTDAPDAARHPVTLTGAQIVAEVLIEQGADTVFAYPGGSVLNIFDALGARSDRLRVLLPAHEQGGCHAADGYARVSGKCGVMIATSGPGATNLVTGLANAYMDSVPLVAITGNVTRALMGRDSFQEVDICGVTMPITKHGFLVQRVETLAETLKEAFAIATSGRPGPVLVDIPKDITAETCEYLPVGRYRERDHPPVKDNILRQAADMIARSKRPLLFCGGGVVRAGASDALRAFAEKRGIPVASSLMGLTALPSSHPLMLGMIGMHGTPVSNYAGEECDLLINAGSRFSDRVAGDRKRFAPNARLIHLDIDPSEFDKNVICDLHLRGDAGDILQKLTGVVPANTGNDWQNEITHFKAKHPMPEEMEPLRANPRGILRAIAGLAGNDALIVTDVGQHQMWTAQYYPFAKPRSLITSGGLGAMGFGMGAAVGAKAAAPDRPVVLITGDGSFHMDMGEIAASVTEGLPVVAVVMNNGVLGMVRQWQRMFYDARFSYTTPGRKTDFAKLAEALGGLGFRADTMSLFTAAFKEALASGQTCVIDCVIDPDENVFPMIPPGKAGNDIVYCEG
ncbi:MAG: biosynthetic-type acetolactate synthase large subunit [Oscillospiraceae bacterium]|jgi:acetolactate synthase-1/2/3 large subunit|nr:biosynthetic-type acetolactate synthase large subunit [Oscillospiraceae bacterium]